MLTVNWQQKKQRLLQYPRVESFLIAPHFNHEGLEDYDDGQDHENYNTHSMQVKGGDGDIEAGSTILTPGQTLQGTGFRPREITDIPWLGGSLVGHNDSPPSLPNIRLTTRDVTRWRMAWRAVQVYNQSGRSFDLPHGEPIVRRCADWPNVWEFYQPPIALGFGVVALVYGGLHALAWFAYFHSSTEQQLWRISVCLIMGVVPVTLVLFTFVDHLQGNDHRFLEECIGRFTLGLAAFIILPAYISARAYLVIECFINLSHLPAEVYDVPRWSAYFPHIS